MEVFELLAAGGDAASIIIAMVLYTHSQRINRLENKVF